MNGWWAAYMVILVLCGLVNITISDSFEEFLGRMFGAVIQWAFILLIIRLFVWLFTG